VKDCESFIAWKPRQRSAGKYACFAVALRGSDTAIGLSDARAGAGLRHGGMGLAIGSGGYWHRRVFQDGAENAGDVFAFDQVVCPARSASRHQETLAANGALRKIGAVAKGGCASRS